MDKQPLVSIIIPVYNVAPYIRRCLDSILLQTYNHLEIILVDDGSTDGSGKICDEYAREDERICVIHKKNSGLSEARNVGIMAATADYIAFVDSDDYISLTYTKRLVQIFLEYDADIAVCGYYSGKKEQFPENKKYHEKNYCYTSKEMLTEWHGKFKHIETIAWNKLYKKALFIDNDIFYPVGFYNEDVQTTHLLVEKAQKIVITNEKLYYYYRRKESITHTLSEKEIRDCIYSQHVRLSFFKSHGYQKAYERLLIKYQKYLMLNYCKVQTIQLVKYKKNLLEKFIENYQKTIQTTQIKLRELFLFWMFLKYYPMFDVMGSVINAVCTGRKKVH